MARRNTVRRKRTVQIAEGVQTQWECGRCHIPAMPDTAFTQIDPRYATGVCARCGDRALLKRVATVQPLRAADAPP